MSQPTMNLLRTSAFKNSNKLGWDIRRLATVDHPNRGNFSSRPREEVVQIGRKGGRKGGKAKGVGGFHEMDPQKQHEIAARGGRASHKRTGREPPQGLSRGTIAAEGTPSSAPPGFEESSTA